MNHKHIYVIMILTFWRETRRDRIVSSLGLLDLKHRGHKNFRSLAAGTIKEEELRFFKLADFGTGTQTPEKERFLCLQLRNTFRSIDAKLSIFVIRRI